MSQIGLVPSIQNLGQVVQQAEAAVTKTADIMKGVTSPNGLKIPGGASLDKLLGSLPTGISTIASVASSFASVSAGFNSASQQLAKVNGLGGFLNSAIGTAQTLTGAAQSVVGAASSLGINLGALGGLAKEIAGVDPTSDPKGQTPEFSMTPRFEWEIKSEGPGLFFPSDLDFNYHPMIQLSIKDYEKATLVKSPTYKSNTSIFLPLPRDLNEDYTPQWTQYSPGPLRMWAQEALSGVEVAAANASDSGEKNIANAMAEITSLVTNMQKNPDQGTKSITAGAAGYAQMGLYFMSGGSDTGSGLLGNFTGRAVNPFTTVAFQGMNLRTHNFVWAFAPKSEEETIKLDKILSVLRVATLPLQKQGGFLMYPKIVSVRFLPVEHYNFKPCVITGLRINHAGSGQPSFFHKTRKPTVYIVALSLQEIEQYTSNDVGVSSENIKPIEKLNSRTFLDTSDDDIDAIFGNPRLNADVNLTNKTGKR